MSERKKLEETLEGAPDEINGFLNTADELKPLAFSDALIAAMKGTTKKRTVGSLRANSSSRLPVQGANLA